MVMKISNAQPHLEGSYFLFSQPRYLLWGVFMCSSLSRTCGGDLSGQNLQHGHGTLVALSSLNLAGV